MLTLTRQGLLLSLSATVIPSQGSSDVPVSVTNDQSTYVGYTLEPRVGYYLNGIYKSIICVYDADVKTFDIPVEAFKQNGVIDITLALIDNTNANHIETCQAVHATVNKAPLGTVILPDQTTWQEYVRSYVEQYLNEYTTSTVQPVLEQAQQAVTTANQASQTANEASENVHTAYNNLGNYKVENGVLYFMKADGTYNEQGITLAGQSTILDGQNNPILNGSMTPQDNFFDNSDFRQGAINQRGETNYTTSGAKIYTIDGWFIENDGSGMAVGDSFISVVGSFGRRIDIVKQNETFLTFAIQRNLEEVQTITFDASTLNEGQDYTYQIDDNTTFGIYFFNGENHAWAYITCESNINIDFMKLERGQKFTGMPVWNYAIELLKCMRLLQILTFGKTIWTDQYNQSFTELYPLAISMDSTPDVIYDVTDQYNVSAVSAATSVNNAIEIKYTCSSNSGAGHRYTIQVTLSCEPK